MSTTILEAPTREHPYADVDFSILLGRIDVHLKRGQFDVAREILDSAKEFAGEERGVTDQLSLDETLALPLAQTGLPVRTLNALEEHLEIFTVEDLLAHDRETIEETPNLGVIAVKKIYSAIESLGFNLHSGDWSPNL